MNANPDVPHEPDAGATAKAFDARESPAEREATAETSDPRPLSAFEPDPEAVQRARETAEEKIRHQSALRTRRSFIGATAGVIGGVGLLHWLDKSPLAEDLRAPLRSALDFNASLSRALTRDSVLAPTYPLHKAVDLRVNGIYGLKQDLVLDSYRLQLVGAEKPEQYAQYVPDVTAWKYRYTAPINFDKGHETKVDPAKEANFLVSDRRGSEEAGPGRNTPAPNTPGLLLTLADVTRFAKQSFVTQFMCIEGWSQIVQWGGVRLGDLLAAYPPARSSDGALPRYVYMETPNGDYYCGFDLDVCKHTQSLLVTEMSGRPLTSSHGAPLRLHMPMKYGYKQIKRIGLIAYTNTKPDDYWTKLGYDWYAGL